MLDLDQWDKVVNLANNGLSFIALLLGSVIGKWWEARKNKKAQAISEKQRIDVEKENAVAQIEDKLQKHLEDVCHKKDIQLITFSANLIKSEIERFCETYCIRLDDINPELIEFFIISSDGRFDKAALNTTSVTLKDKLRNLVKNAI